MENQIQNQNQQLTVRQQTLSTRIAKVGKLTEIAFAKSTLELSKIKEMDLKDQDQKRFLQQGLSMIFTKASNLIGIKDPISDINKLDIVEMIFSRYTSLSLEEIDYAFRMDRYSGEPVQHFQLFNSEYVGKVLHRYREWLKNTRANNNLPIKKIEQKKELTAIEKEIIVINGVISCFESFMLTNEIEVGKTYVYDYLYAKKLLPKHTKEFRLKIKKKAIKEFYKLKDEVVDKKNWRNTLRDIQTQNNNQIVRCKQIILKTFFYQLISNNKKISEIL